MFDVFDNFCLRLVGLADDDVDEGGFSFGADLDLAGLEFFFTSFRVVDHGVVFGIRHKTLGA